MNEKPNCGFRPVNTFTVRCGGEISVSHNEFLGFDGAFAASAPFAAYLTVGSGTGRAGRKLGIPVAVKPTELGEHNFDASRGPLFATYCVTLGDDDVPPGTEIREAGLTHDDSGEPLADYSNFDAVVKKSGVDMTVRAEIRLDVKSDALAFVAGDNALAKAFLGERKMGAEFALATSDNYHPTAPIKLVPGEKDKLAPATATYFAGGVAVSAEFDKAPHETILVMDGEYVMRGFRAAAVETSSRTANVGANNMTVDVGDEHVVDIVGITTPGKDVGYTYLKTYPLRLTGNAPDAIPFRLPARSRLLTEPTRRSMAVKDDREVTVYELGSGGVKERYKVKVGESAHAELTTFGALLVADGSVTLYAAESGEPTPVGDIRSAREAHCVADRGKYLFVVVSSDGVHLLHSDDLKTFSQTEEISPLPPDIMCMRHDECFIDIFSRSKGIFRSEGARGQNELVGFALEMIGTSSEYADARFSERWMTYSYRGRTYCGNFEGMNLVAVPEGEERLPVGDYLLRIKDGAIYAADTFSGEDVMTRRLELDGEYPVPYSAVQLGDYILLCFPDGTVRTLYAVPYGRTLFCPFLQYGEKVSFTAVKLADPIAAAPARVTVTLGWRPSDAAP